MRRLIPAIVVALVVVACGNAAEEITERAIENAAGDEGDVDIEIDEESGSGTMVIETDDGTQTMSFGGGELPDGLEVPVMDGGTVMGATESEAGDQSFIQVSLEYENADFDALVAFYDDYFDGMSDTFRNEYSDASSKTVSWSTSDGSRSVSVSDIDGVIGVGILQTG